MHLALSIPVSLLEVFKFYFNSYDLIKGIYVGVWSSNTLFYKVVIFGLLMIFFGIKRQLDL